MISREVHTTEKVARVLGKIQRNLELEGIPSWIGGGVGVDLIRSKEMPEEPSRLHHDGDLYISICQRAKAIDVLVNNGVAVDFEHETPEITYTQIEGLNVDLFSIRDDGEQPIVKQITSADLVRHNGFPKIREPIQRIRKQVNVNLIPEVVCLEDKNLRVLCAQSLRDIASMKDEVEPKTRRDIQVLGKIIGKRG